MFGGIEPSNMKTFSAISYFDITTGKNVVKLYLELPGDTAIPGSVFGLGVDVGICTVGGVIIRKKQSTSYAEDEFDGELFADIAAGSIPSEGYIIDENVEANKHYTYTAFVYSGQGVFNHEPSTAGVDVSNQTYLYGYDIDLSDENPNTRVSYPADVMNYGSSPGVANWNLVIGEKFMPEPCMLTYGGLSIYRLDPNDYTKILQGGDSGVADTRFEGNAMMEWPKIYTKRWTTTDSDGNEIYHFRCSDAAPDNSWVCFYNTMYTAIYPCSLVDSKFRSLSGQTIYKYNSAWSERRDSTYVTNNGSNWSEHDIRARLLINDLLTLICCSTDLKTNYGTGSTITTSGAYNTDGLFNNNGKVFGMEGLWNMPIVCGNISATSGLEDLGSGSAKDYFYIDFSVDSSDYGKAIVRVDGNYTVDYGDNDETGNEYATKSLCGDYGRLCAPYKAKDDGLTGSSSKYDCSLFKYSLDKNLEKTFSVDVLIGHDDPYSIYAVNSVSNNTVTAYHMLTYIT